MHKPNSATPINSPKPPFRKMDWLPRDIAVERRDDGVVLLKSRFALQAYARHIPALLARWAAERPAHTWLAQRKGADRQWQRVSYSQAQQTVDSLTQGLLDLQRSGSLAAHPTPGSPPGPKPSAATPDPTPDPTSTPTAGRPLVILSGNSVEHALMTMAAMQAGMPVAPISPAYSLMSQDHAKLKYLIALVQPAVLMVQDAPQFERALQALDLSQTTVVHVDRASPNISSIAFAGLAATPATADVAAAMARITPDTVGKLLFTSGSTGMPKAVINTQKMMCANVAMASQVRRYPPGHEAVFLDWMPWNHTMGGNALFNALLNEGGTLYIDDGRPTPTQFDETLRNLREVSPTYYANVPAGYAALAAALEKDEALCASFFKNLGLMAYGGARLPDDLYARMQALAVRSTGQRVVFYTGWGSTETAPTSTGTYWDTERVGLIGLPFPGVELKLVPAGPKYELRLRGINVTPGYFGQPELTRAMLDDEGFYCIGDAGTFVDPADPAQGLIFAGRVAEEFKLTIGTFVQVGDLRTDAIAAASPVLLDALVTGQDLPFVGLLAWPNLAACRQLMQQPEATLAQVVQHPAVLACVRAGLAAHNASAGGASSRRIERLLLLIEPPSIDGNELTDKGYINQRAGLARRSAWVDRLYAEPPDAEVLVLG